jgi:hypothetical protein
MNAAGMAFGLATRRDRKSVREGDVSVAISLSQAVGKPLTLIDLPSPTFDDALSLLQLKGGTNYLPMSFMLPYLRELGESYGGDLIYWSGDTGIALRRYLPKHRLRSEDELVDFLVQRQYGFSLEEVAALLRIAPRTIHEQIKSVLMAFPERSAEQRYVHFVVAGRLMKWHYEGMDRNRCFYWTCSPLEFTPFCEYAMNCPEEQKTDFRLYREVLMRLCPELARFPVAPYTVAPSSRRFMLEMSMRSIFRSLPPRLVDMVKVVLGRKIMHPRAGREIEECLRRQVLRSEAVRELFAVEEVERCLQRCDHLSAKVILTVTSTIELYSRGETALADYTGLKFE